MDFAIGRGHDPPFGLHVALPPPVTFEQITDCNCVERVLKYSGYMLEELSVSTLEQQEVNIGRTSRNLGYFGLVPGPGEPPRRR